MGSDCEKGPGDIRNGTARGIFYKKAAEKSEPKKSSMVLGVQGVGGCSSEDRLRGRR